MKQQTSPAIVLRRTNYGEADRIITFLTPVGKVRALVKGVRRSKSKLGGGIELFSESKITFMLTRGDLARVISSRLETHWDNFLGDLQRMLFGYEAMKLIDKVVEDEASRDYFELLKSTLASLNDLEINLNAIETWFYLRLLTLEGHQPNLKTDSKNEKLHADGLYNFLPDEMCFSVSSSGTYRAEHIKLLRLFLNHQPQIIKNIKNADELTKEIKQVLKQAVNSYL